MNISSQKLAICAIAKNEHYYINDWVMYHLDMGIDHIYIYDNEEIEDESKYIGHFIDRKYSDRVTIIDAHGKKAFQLPAYADCWKTYRSIYDWVLFIDIDEFLTIADGRNIKDILSNPEYQKWDGIRLNWIIYSDGNQIYGDLSIPVWERFRMKSTHVNSTELMCTKSFINTHTKNNIAIGVHRCHPGNLCHPNLEVAHQIDEKSHWSVDKFETSIMYIRHYPTKTVTEFKLQKFYRTDVNGIKHRNTQKHYMWWFNEKTKEKDDILDTMPLDEIKKNLEKTWTTRPKDTIL